MTDFMDEECSTHSENRNACNDLVRKRDVNGRTISPLLCTHPDSGAHPYRLFIEHGCSFYRGKVAKVALVLSWALSPEVKTAWSSASTSHKSS